MTREEAKAYFIDDNERTLSAAKDENRYNYETQQIEDVFMRRDFEAKEKAIKALELKPCEDCVRRESVIEWLKDKDIIKTKNQEENARRELVALPSVTPTDILDKIRDEIRKLDDINPDYPMDRTIHLNRNEVLEIIDKYRKDGGVDDAR